MPLSWNEIRDRAFHFSKRWADAHDEQSHGKPFWIDFRYSKDIVYNNFPWPESPTDAQRAKIEAAAQGVLDARAAFPNASLADLYDPLTMPQALTKAHQALDAAVEAAYGKKGFKSDAERVAFLFALYQKYTSLLPAQPTRPRRSTGKAGD